MEAANLDAVDWQILSILQLEARISFKELGQRIGLTGTAIAERVRKLEDEGIIKAYIMNVLNRYLILLKGFYDGKRETSGNHHPFCIEQKPEGTEVEVERSSEGIHRSFRNTTLY